MLKKRMIALITAFIFTFTTFVGAASGVENDLENIEDFNIANHEAVTESIYESSVHFKAVPFVAGDDDLYVYENFEYLGPDETFVANMYCIGASQSEGATRTDGVREFGNSVEDLINNGLKAGTPGTDPTYDSNYYSHTPYAVLINKNTINDDGKITVKAVNWDASNTINTATLNRPTPLMEGMDFLKGSGNTVAGSSNYAVLGRPFIEGAIKSDNEIWFSLLVYVDKASYPPVHWALPEMAGFSIGNDISNRAAAYPGWDPIFIASKSGMWTVGRAKNVENDNSFESDNYDPIDDPEKKEKAAIKYRQNQLLIGRATLDPGAVSVTTRLFVVNDRADFDELFASENVNELAVATYTSTNMGPPARKITSLKDLNAFGFSFLKDIYMDDIRIGGTLAAVAPLKRNEIDSVTFKQEGKILGSSVKLSSKKETEIEVNIASPTATGLDVKLECNFNFSGKESVKKEYASTDLGENLKGFKIPKMSELFSDNIFPDSVDYVISDKNGNMDADGQTEVRGNFGINREVEELKIFYGGSELEDGSILTVARSSDTRERTASFEITTTPLNPSIDSLDWSGEAVSGGFFNLKSAGKIINGKATATAAIGKSVGNKPLILTVGGESINFNFNVTHIPVESVVLKDVSGETFDTAKGIVLTDFSPSKSLTAAYSPSDADILSTPVWSISGSGGVAKLEQTAERYVISKLGYGSTEITLTVNGAPYKFPVNIPSTITEVTALSFTGGQDNGKFYVEASAAEIDRELRSFVKIEPSNATIQSLTWEVVEGSDVIDVTNGDVDVLKKGTAKIKVTAHNGKSIFADVETIIPIARISPKDISVMKDKTVRITMANLDIEPLIGTVADIVEIKYMTDSNDKVEIENLGMSSYLTGKMAGTAALKAVVTCSAVNNETGELTTLDTDVTGINLSVNVDPEEIILNVSGNGDVDSEKNIIYIDTGKSVDVTAAFKPDDCNANSISWRFIDYIDLGYRGANPYNSYIGSGINATDGVVSGSFKITSKGSGNVPILVLKAGNVEKQFTIIERSPQADSLEYWSKDIPEIAFMLAEGTVTIDATDYVSKSVSAPMIYRFHSKEDNIPVTLDFNWQSAPYTVPYIVSFKVSITNYSDGKTLGSEAMVNLEHEAPTTRERVTTTFAETTGKEKIYFNKGLNVVVIAYDNGIESHRGLTVKWPEDKAGVISKSFNYMETLSIDNEKLNRDILNKGIVNFKPSLKDYLVVTPGNATVDRYDFQIASALGEDSNIEIIDRLSGKLNIKKAGKAKIEVTAVAPDAAFSKSAQVEIDVPEVNTTTAEICIDNDGFAGSPLDTVNLVPKFLRDQTIRVLLDKNATNTTSQFVVLNSSGAALSPSALTALGIEISGSGNEAKLKIADNAIFGDYFIEAQILDKDGKVVKTTKVPLNISNDYVKVAKLDIAEKDHHIRRGQAYKLTSEVSPTNATNKNVRWELAKPTDSEYVTLLPNGEVVGIKANPTPVLVRMISDDNGMQAQTEINVDKVRISDSLQDEELMLTMGVSLSQTANTAINIYDSAKYRNIVTNFNNYIKAYPYEAATGKPWAGSTDFRTLSLKKTINEGLASVFGVTAFTNEELEAMDDDYFANFAGNLINGKRTMNGARYSTRFGDLRLANVLKNGNTELNTTEEFSMRLGAVPKENYEIIGLPDGLEAALEIFRNYEGEYELSVALNGVSKTVIDSDLEFTIRFKPVIAADFETEGDLKAVSLIYPVLEEETELKVKINCAQTLVPTITPKDSSITMAGEYGLSSDHTFSVEVNFDNVVVKERSFDPTTNSYVDNFETNTASLSRPVSIIQGTLPKAAYRVRGLPEGMAIEKAEANGKTVVFTVINNSLQPVTKNVDVYVTFEPTVMQTVADTKSASAASKAVYTSKEIKAATIFKGENTTGTTVSGGGGGGGGGSKIEKYMNSQSDIIIENTSKGKIVTADVRLESVMKEIETKQDSVLSLDINEAASGAFSSALRFDASIIAAAFERNNIVKLDSNAAILTMPVDSISPTGEMRYSVQNTDYTITASLTDSNGEVEFSKPVEIMVIYDTKALPVASNLVLAKQNPNTKLFEPLEDYAIVSNGVMKGNVTSLGIFKVIEKEATEETPPETAPTEGFGDLDSVLWAKDAIIALSKAGIIKGKTPTEFGPQDYLTRAQLAALIVRALGLGISDTVPTFDDVESGAWFKADVDILSSHGIILGSEGKFRPNDEVTRQEMATIISRALALETDVEVSLDFEDRDDTADWALDAIYACVKNGLLTGMGDNIFAPLENTTRAQAAVVIYRIVSRE